MRYSQYRLAKRNGEIVQQHRYVHTTTKPLFKWWQLWKLGQYEVSYDYDDWRDMPMENLTDPNNATRPEVKNAEIS